MAFFNNKKKYLIAVLLGLALGIAIVAGGIITYNYIYPENSANAVVSEPPQTSVSLPSNIPDIVEKASDAVVFIESTVKTESTTDPFFNDPFFRYFFGNEFPTQPMPKVSKGIGSGFIFNPDGYIITNEHVIENATEITVTVKGFEKPLKAEVVGKDFDLDLAILKINPSKKLPYLPLGDSNKMRVGEWVIAIGNPYSLDHTVTVGVISAKERPITILDKSNQKRVYKNLIQTDAAINPGNSGGPLISLNGEVIGINTAVNAEAQGIGFAIPMDTVKEVLDDLIKNGKVTRPYIGVGLQDLTKDLADYFKLEKIEGAVITYIFPESPAEVAGLKQGDIILKINDKKIVNSNDVSEIVKKAKINDKLMLMIYRNGQTLYKPVKIAAKP
jgi:serine protease Do